MKRLFGVISMKLIIIVLISFVLVSCGGGGGGGTGVNSPPPVTDVTQIVGPGGGTVTLTGGPSLVIPAGALGSSTAITIRKSTSSAPTGALGPLYEFEPSGQAFASPVMVGFPVAQGTAAALVYWTKASTTAEYDALATTLAGTTASASVTHFSNGYVGGPFQGLAECTAQGSYRMYSLLEALYGILRHEAFNVALPAGVTETSATPPWYAGYDFWIRDDHVSATIKYSTAPYPVGSTAIFHWTLAQDARASSTGEGEFSAWRMGADSVQVSPVTLTPWFEPVLDCRVEHPSMGFYWYYFLSTEPEMKPTSIFQANATISPGLDWQRLANQGSVGYSGMAAMSGNYLGVPFSYQINLRTGAVTY